MDKLIMTQAQSPRGRGEQNIHAEGPHPGGASPRMNKGNKSNRQNMPNYASMNMQGGPGTNNTGNVGKTQRYGKMHL